ncbi:MAG: repressor LexA [Halothiobacillaceae bacterium]|nr:MAG: repressor LexA [Halothiobacillaceae bacterium]
MDELTARQAEIFQFILDHIQETGFPPTRAEIAAHFGFRSVNAAEDHLKALERKGVIEILAGTSRGIRLLIAKGLPVIGKVASGSSIAAEENVEGNFEVDARLFKPRANFFVKVKDNSMRDAGILEGDLVAVSRGKSAQNGQIVVARLGGKLAVRRFKRKSKNQITLSPEGKGFEGVTIDTREEEGAVEGSVVGLIRQKNFA